MTVAVSQPTVDFILLALSFVSGLLVTEFALAWMRGRRK
jgi:hypothetical protein